MQDRINEIFENNKRLLGLIDKAIIYFRECRYDKALEAIAETGDGINFAAEAILKNREYFKLVSTESVAEMLQGILNARHNKDYVLLADLYEMQLANFICSVQELILKQEDYFAYSEEEYNRNIVFMSERLGRSLIRIAGYSEDDDEKERLRVNQNAKLEEPLNPSEMLKEGYCVEYTSCGLMTLGAPDTKGRRIYLHTNAKILSEAFLLAKSWADEKTKCYVVYGYGMGYHIHELRQLVPEARIIIFESDMNVLKLCCAFAGDYALMDSNTEIMYDPEMEFINDELLSSDGTKVCIHYPSFRRLKESKGKAVLGRYIPWSRKVEEC